MCICINHINHIIHIHATHTVTATEQQVTSATVAPLPPDTPPTDTPTPEQPLESPTPPTPPPRGDQDTNSVVAAVLAAADAAGLGLTVQEVQLLVTNMSTGGGDMNALLTSAQRVIAALAADAVDGGVGEGQAVESEGSVQEEIQEEIQGEEQQVQEDEQQQEEDVETQETAHMSSPPAPEDQQQQPQEEEEEEEEDTFEGGATARVMIALVEAALVAGVPDEVAQDLPRVLAKESPETIKAMTVTLMGGSGAALVAVLTGVWVLCIVHTCHDICQ